MKHIGNLVKKYGIKPTIHILYLLPVALLSIGIVVMGFSMFRNVAGERNYYYAGMGVLLVLIVILLAARAAALPQYYFELYEKGIKIVYRKEKVADEIFTFEEISEIWNLSADGIHTQYFVFLPVGGDYKTVSSKYSNYRHLVKSFTAHYLKEIAPKKSLALTGGERLIFQALPDGGENVVQSEKAVVPYLKDVQKAHLSLDRFSVFDGQRTYSLADVQSAKIDTGYIVVVSVANGVLYRKSCFAVCNADLFVRLVNDTATPKTENTETVV
ncbi:MAG: hypothetical protein QM610_05900 [Chitinophagaceae bacterium]